MNHFGVPGIGGSLGKCAICGETFITEMITGANIKTFKQAGCSTTFYAHNKCLEDAQKCETLLDLPETSPLRQAYERQERERTEASINS